MTLRSALKAAAARLGIQQEEYELRIAAGQRICRRCRNWRAMFDGPLCPFCKNVRNKKQSRYIEAAMEGRSDG
mgnify:CR=1 FL=1